MTNSSEKNINITKLDAKDLIFRSSNLSRDANEVLKNSSNNIRNKALFKIASLLHKEKKKILCANKKDLENAHRAKLSPAFIDRLELSSDRIELMAESIVTIADLDDPIGVELERWKVPSGLDISKVTSPIGVIGIIYESRPNVTIDSAGLCIKSGNTAILRCGSDAINTCILLGNFIQKGLKNVGLPKNCIQLIKSTDRKVVTAMLKASDCIDVIIPRGGKQLVSKVQRKAKVPVFSHLDGVCHVYIEAEADLSMARKICLNSKMRRVGICGAAETILIDEKIASKFVKPIIDDLHKAGCEIRGDKIIQSYRNFVKPALEKDWYTEYLSPIISVRVVQNLENAIEHIKKYGSSHTETIITNNKNSAEKFFKKVDSAIVMLNASTQFADGGEFGMGAEIGIATGRLHARGPVGIKQLVSHKYVVRGEGHLRK